MAAITAITARRPRRPFLLLLSLLLAGLLGACNLPASGPSPSSTGDSAEAEKTRQMEEKAAEIERRAEEIRNMEGTEQEKIDALNELDKERRELNEMGGN
jgi:hypothetical protein